MAVQHESGILQIKRPPRPKKGAKKSPQIRLGDGAQREGKEAVLLHWTTRAGGGLTVKAEDTVRREEDVRVRVSRRMIIFLLLPTSMR
jgi:hypothetical protein